MEGKQQSKKNPPTALKKAVKNINTLISVGDISVSAPKNEAVAKPKVVRANVDVKKRPRVSMDRGVVYLGHIPHGFYEEEMKGFFGQFGHVTRLRLVRSNKTGNSRGFAFVEFRFKEVAQVVAETMNNYLMQNRLLKAVYIPPEKQSAKMFTHCRNYGPETCIGVRNRRAAIERHNKSLTPEQQNARTTTLKQHLISLQEKLKSRGVDCLFQVDDGSSQRLFEEVEGSPPPKRVRTASPAPKMKTSKLATTVKEAKMVVSKGQTSQKQAKGIKSSKAGDKISKKTAAVDKISKKTAAVDKSTEKKTTGKKTAGKKIVKKVVKKSNVAKAGSIKKETKKLVKKQSVKKK